MVRGCGRRRAGWIGIGGLIVGLGCGGSPTMPTDTNRATHLMHVQAASACAGVLPKNIPVELWDVPLQLTAEGSHLTGGFPGATRISPSALVDLAISGSTVSGGIGATYWTGSTFRLEISQLGEPGYVAQATGTVSAAGTIAGTLNGRISIFDTRVNPSGQWFNCDSGEHHFSISPVRR
jgi:hypothetical protein